MKYPFKYRPMESAGYYLTPTEGGYVRPVRGLVVEVGDFRRLLADAVRWREHIERGPITPMSFTFTKKELADDWLLAEAYKSIKSKSGLLSQEMRDWIAKQTKRANARMKKSKRNELEKENGLRPFRLRKSK